MKVYILLDRSGSMANMWDEALGSINGYVAKLKKNPKVFVASFDSNEPFVVHRDCRQKTFKPLTNEDAEPRGGTPLNDATAAIVLQMLKDDEDKAILVVMTDGAENSSKEFTRGGVKDLLAHAKGKGFESVFLGANFEGVEHEAMQYGMQVNRSIPTRRGLLGETFNTLATKTNVYMSAQNSTEAAATMDWTEVEKYKVNKP